MSLADTGPMAPIVDEEEAARARRERINRIADVTAETPIEEEGSAAKILFGVSWWL